MTQNVAGAFGMTALDDEQRYQAAVSKDPRFDGVFFSRNGTSGPTWWGAPCGSSPTASSTGMASQGWPNVEPVTGFSERGQL